MKKRIAAFLLCLITIFSLVSCGGGLPEDAEPPEGMQYAGGEAYGFYMFVPEEWTLSSIDHIVGAFVSTLDISSVSLTEVKKPAAFVDIDTYFKASMEDMPFSDYTLVKDGISFTLGSTKGANITSAKAYEYTYSYEIYGGEEGETHKYRVLQVFGEFGGRLYAFTYTALDELKTEEKTYFKTHENNVYKVMENVKFISPKTSAEEPKEYEKDADGYLKVADKGFSGFDFYMHPDWTCTMASGIVEVTSPEKASINMTEATDTGVVVSDYFKKRKSDLERYTDGAITVLKENEAISFGNADRALAYEYTYSFRGVAYHTYQVILVHDKIPVFLQKGYVFTFTATEDCYASQIGAVMKMIGKVRF